MLVVKSLFGKYGCLFSINIPKSLKTDQSESENLRPLADSFWEFSDKDAIPSEKQPLQILYCRILGNKTIPYKKQPLQILYCRILGNKAILYEKQPLQILYCRILGSKAILYEKQPLQILYCRILGSTKFSIRMILSQNCYKNLAQG